MPALDFTRTRTCAAWWSKVKRKNPGLRKDSPQECLSRFAGQINPDHWSLNLFGDMCVNPSRLVASEPTNCSCKASCARENFHKNQIGEFVSCHTAVKLIIKMTMPIKTALDPSVRLGAHSIGFVFVRQGVLWRPLPRSCLSSHRSIALVCRVGTEAFHTRVGSFLA